MPAKRVATTPSPEREAPSPPSPKRERDHSGPTPEPEPKPKRQRANKAQAAKSSAGDKTGSWSPDELQALFEAIHPKKMGIAWDAVAAQVPGRNVKSCKNKWASLQKTVVLAVRDSAK